MFRLTILFFALFVFATQAFDNDRTTGSSKSQNQQQASFTANRQP